MTQKSELGNYGEDLACEYLTGKGYRVIERNYRKPWGELDIVARAPDKTLVFAEVKTMASSTAGLKPEDQMSLQKILKTQKAARLYAGYYPKKIDEKRGWRIDLITLTLRYDSGSIPSKLDGLTINKKDCEIKHYENI